MLYQTVQAHELFMNTHSVAVIVTDTQAYYYIDYFSSSEVRLQID